MEDAPKVWFGAMASPACFLSEDTSCGVRSFIQTYPDRDPPINPGPKGPVVAPKTVPATWPRPAVPPEYREQRCCSPLPADRAPPCLPVGRVAGPPVAPRPAWSAHLHHTDLP